MKRKFTIMDLILIIIIFGIIVCCGVFYFTEQVLYAKIFGVLMCLWGLWYFPYIYFTNKAPKQVEPTVISQETLKLNSYTYNTAIIDQASSVQLKQKAGKKYRVYHNGKQLTNKTQCTLTENTQLEIVEVNNLLSPWWLLYSILNILSSFHTEKTMEECFVTKCTVTLGKINSSVVQFVFGDTMSNLQINGVDQYTIGQVTSNFSRQCHKRLLISKYITLGVVAVFIFALGILALCADIQL